MNRYHNQLAGLSLPLNLFAVIVHILAVFTIILSQIQFFKPFEQLMLWIGIPTLVLSLLVIVVLKGYYLLVQHARLTMGFVLLILSLIHISACGDFYIFLTASAGGENNPFDFIQVTKSVPYILGVLEFVMALALIIGAWTRFISAVLVLLFGFYAGLFWYSAATIQGDLPQGLVLSFGLNMDLVQQLNWNTAFVFCLFMVVIGLVGIVFGGKVRPNSIKLNWAIIPVYSILTAGLAVILHWYQIIFIVPLSILFCLIIYRSGGRFLGNHFGAMLMALIMGKVLCLFSQELGLAEKQSSSISTENKGGK